MLFRRQFVLAGFALTASTALADGLECRAIFRSVDQNGRVIEMIESIPVLQRFGVMTQYAIDHQGRHFHVSDDGGQTYLVQIVQPPDYTRGIVTRAAPDARGTLNVAEVNGHDVYKVECKKRER